MLKSLLIVVPQIFKKWSFDSNKNNSLYKFQHTLPAYSRYKIKIIWAYLNCALLQHGLNIPVAFCCLTSLGAHICNASCPLFLQPTTSWSWAIPLFTGMAVSVFYCCVTNYHGLSDLKQQPFITSQFCGSEIWVQCGSAGFFAQTIDNKVDITVLDGLCSFPGMDPVPSSFLLSLNSVPGSCRRKVLAGCQPGVSLCFWSLICILSHTYCCI